jgi:hypothetical protein
MTISRDKYIKNTIKITEDVKTSTVLKQKIYIHKGHWQFNL